MKLKSTILILIFAATPVFSDTITFRDGSALEGKLTGQTRFDITVLIDGKEQTFQKKNLRRVSYGETAEEKKKFEELKRKSERLKSGAMSVDEKSRQLAVLQNEIEKLFKQQEERRKVAEKLDEEFQVLLKKEISGPNALLRQAAFPGWGHWYRGENTKAVSWASGFSAILFGVVSLKGAAANSESAYKTSVMTTTLLSSQLTAGAPVYTTALYHMALAEGKYASYEKSAARFNQSVTVLTAVYLASLMHLAWDNWFKGKSGEEESTKESMNRPQIDFYFAENTSPENKREKDMGFILSLRF